MRRVRSNLKGSGFAIIILAGVNLFVLLCMCLLMTSYRAPRHGLNVRATTSHYALGAYDRSQSHVITVTPGDPPRIYMEDREVAHGIEGLDSELDAWSASAPAGVTVIIVSDEAVAVGIVQKVMEKVIKHGYTCALFGRPALDE